MSGYALEVSIPRKSVANQNRDKTMNRLSRRVSGRLHSIPNRRNAALRHRLQWESFRVPAESGCGLGDISLALWQLGRAGARILESARNEKRVQGWLHPVHTKGRYRDHHVGHYAWSRQRGVSSPLRVIFLAFQGPTSENSIPYQRDSGSVHRQSLAKWLP